ncbi:unnamed protein product [Haemonchus placei]|uniref:NR LBD domain-containing protein n=1 Tax=Haemonchus placei TaxID=6290 RepID=A0A0N4WXX5_HAEPC|nr:unnamed protein product [Haemonchus placei]
MFTSLQRLQDIQRSKAVELHKMILLTKCLIAMLMYRGDDMDKLSDYVMRKFQFIMVRKSAKEKFSKTLCSFQIRVDMAAVAMEGSSSTLSPSVIIVPAYTTFRKSFILYVTMLLKGFANVVSTLSEI